MNKSPCVQITFTYEERRKLHGKKAHSGLFGLDPPYISEPTDKETLIKDGSEFIEKYESLGDVVEEWRKLLRDLND